MSVIMITTQEMQKLIANKARSLRLELNLSQHSLAKKSGVSYSTLKKFEQTGQISLESLLKLALVLECMDGFNSLFAPFAVTSSLSLDKLIEDKKRKRGRK